MSFWGFYRLRVAVATFAGILSFVAGLGAVSQADNVPPLAEYTLPSALPAGNPVVDTIYFQWRPALSDRLAVTGRLPAVVIVPGLGDTDNSPQDQRAADYLTEHGISCAILTLPYDGRRVVSGLDAQDYFLSKDATVVAQAMLQSASDIESVRAWLAQRPDVDVDHIGVIGWSEGAIIVHLAMGIYPQIRVGVAIGGGADLADIRRRSFLLLPQQLFHKDDSSPAQLKALSKADPITYAANNRPRHVLMIEGARDNIIPPHDSTRLWEALGKPPIEWADMGHLGLGWTETPELAAAYSYLTQNWAPPDAPDPPVPPVGGAVIKLGFLTIANSRTVLAVQDQALGIGNKRDHTAILSLDVGVTTSRPFAAIGYTANHYIDLGVAMRVTDHAPQPYLSMYCVF